MPIPRYKRFDDLAIVMVNDGHVPNVYFVSTAEVGVIAIVRDFVIAYKIWKSLPKNVESKLGDRLRGWFCRVEEKAGHMIVVDTADEWDGLREVMERAGLPVRERKKER